MFNNRPASRRLTYTEARIAGALGGRAAEQLVFGSNQVTTGERDSPSRLWSDGPPPKQIHSPENSIEHFLNLQNWWNLCLDVFSFSKRVYFQVPCEFSALIFWIHPQIQIYTLSFKTKKSGDRKKQVPSLKLT